MILSPKFTTLGMQAGPRYVPTLQEIFSALSIATPTVLLDAGDAASYPGSGQTWADISGNGNDFWLGETSGVETSSPTDPLFSGVAGRKSEAEYFWSNVNQDAYFQRKAGQTWDQDLHKNNFILSSLIVFRPTATMNLWGTMNTTPIDGVALQLDSPDNEVRFRHSITNTTQNSRVTTAQVQLNQINIISMSADEGASAFVAKVNQNATETGSIASSTATDPPAHEFTLGSYSQSGGMPVNSRLYLFAFWVGTALSVAQVNGLNKYLKELRFPSAV